MEENGMCQTRWFHFLLYLLIMQWVKKMKLQPPACTKRILSWQTVYAASDVMEGSVAKRWMVLEGERYFFNELVKEASEQLHRGQYRLKFHSLHYEEVVLEGLERCEMVDLSPF